MDKSPLMYMDRSPPMKTEILKFNSLTHINPQFFNTIPQFCMKSKSG